MRKCFRKRSEDSGGGESCSSSSRATSGASLTLRETFARKKMYGRMSALEEIGGFLAEELAASRRENAVLLQRLKSSKKEDVVDERRNSKQMETEVGNAVVGGGREPLEVFPAEIWNMILEHITEPQDLAACYRTTSIWAKELKSQRPQFLFYEVLPILVRVTTMLDANWELRTFNPDSLLSLRPVCHAWKSGVNLFFEGNPCHFHLHEESCLPTCYFRDGNKRDYVKGDFFQFKTPQDILRCQELVSKYPGMNVFLNRRITFKDSSSNQRQAALYWPSVYPFLSHSDVGMNIWYCDLRITAFQDAVATYQIILQCLELMPNLKMLRLYHHVPTDLTGLEELETYLKSSSPLPHLENLIVLKASRLPHLLINQLVNAYGRQLTKFQLSPDPGPNSYPMRPFIEVHTEYYNEFEHLELPNLEAFSAPVYSLEDCIKLGELLTTCNRLETLCMTVDCAQYNDFEVIFQKYLSKYQNTGVKTLNLRLSVESSSDSGERSHLSVSTRYIDINKLIPLPNLQELTIWTEMEFDFMNIDFILSLKNLRRLTIVRKRKDFVRSWKKPKPNAVLSSSAHSVLKFYGYFDRMYESNIWALMPKLSQVIVKVSKVERDYAFNYTREVLEQKRKDNYMGIKELIDLCTASGRKLPSQLEQTMNLLFLEMN